MAEADIITDNHGRQRIGVHTQMREKNLIKQVPGARYDGELQMWTTPASYTACVQLQAIFGKAIEAGDSLKGFAQSGYKYAMERAQASKAEDAVVRHVRAAELAPLQRAGAAFLRDGDAILADEMGSGKTVQAAVALEILHPSLSLVVCPNSVKRAWETHVNDWTTLEPFVVKGSAKQRAEIIQAAAWADHGGVLIMNWEQLMIHSRLAAYGNIRLTDKEREEKELNRLHFGVIIADEAHRAKNPTGKTTRALKRITGDRRWGLTGTPIANHPGDYWSILNFIDPTEWPSRSQFIDRYCTLQWNVFGGSDIVGLNHVTRDEFYHLTDRYFMRRLKDEIMGRTIKKVPQERYVTLPPKHRKLYDTFKEELIALIDDGAIHASNQLAATARLRQLAAAPLEQNEDEQWRMVAPSPKVKELLELVEDLDGEALVVFSASKQLLYLCADELAKKKIPYHLATGDQSAEERAQMVEEFQAGQGRVFLATTQAMGTGVTLTRAKVLCFIDRDWSMVNNKQAEDRIHRWGQESDSVTIVDIITQDTIDERVYEVFVTKQERLNEITRDQLKEML